MCDPPTVTHHAKRIARGKMFDPPRLKAARDLYYVLLVASGQRPPRPLTGPIRLDIVFCFRGDRLAWHTHKPDRDNLCKTFQDQLVAAGFIAADQQIVAGSITKITGPIPYVRASARVLALPPIVP